MDEEIKPNYIVEFNIPSDNLGWWVDYMPRNGEPAYFHNFQSAIEYRKEREQDVKKDKGYADGLTFRVRNTYTGMTWTGEPYDNPEH